MSIVQTQALEIPTSVKADIEKWVGQNYGVGATAVFV